MKISIGNIIVHFLCVLVGFVFFVLLMNYMSKPTNFPVQFNPSEAFEEYYFSFVYSLGTIGFIIGTIILLLILFILLLFSNWIITKFKK